MGKKAKSDSDAPPSEISTDKKKKKSKSTARDFSDLKFDFKNPPQRVTWVRGDDSTDDWVPTTGDATIPVAVKKEWAKVYSRVTHLDATISPGSP